MHFVLCIIKSALVILNSSIKSVTTTIVVVVRKLIRIRALIAQFNAQVFSLERLSKVVKNVKSAVPFKEHKHSFQVRCA